MSLLSEQELLNLILDTASPALKVKVQAIVASTVQEVMISQADDSIQSCPYRSTLTDKSGICSGTPGTSTQAAAANTSRKYFFIQNPHASAVLYVNFGASAGSSGSSYKLAAGDSLVFEDGFVPTDAVNVASDTASVAYAAKEG